MSKGSDNGTAFSAKIIFHSSLNPTYQCNILILTTNYDINNYDITYQKATGQIDRADIQQLIDDEVQEGKTIEYKSDIIGNKDEQKKEFLADVSSFANASGGHLIIGIYEEKGIPKQISGLQIADIDREISRLENITRDGIEPRISGLNIHPVRIDSLFVIIIFIPQSFALPHIVKYKNHLLRKLKKKEAAEEELILTMIKQKTSRTIISMALLTGDIVQI